MTDTEQANLEAARDFVMRGLGDADLGAFDRHVDPEVLVVTGLSPAAPIRGRDAYKAVFAGFSDAWPCHRMELHEAHAIQDLVVVRFTAFSTFKKDYYGVKANHVIADIQELQLYTFKAGRIVRNIVGAINYPMEFTMYPAIRDAVLGKLEVAQ